MVSSNPRLLFQKVMSLVDEQCNDEPTYLPLVNEYMQLLKSYDPPQKAAVGMTKQMGKVPKEPKAKPKRQAKAKAQA